VEHKLSNMKYISIIETRDLVSFTIEDSPNFTVINHLITHIGTFELTPFNVDAITEKINKTGKKVYLPQEVELKYKLMDYRSCLLIDYITFTLDFDEDSFIPEF